MANHSVRAQAALLCACREHLHPLHLLHQTGSLLGGNAASAFALAGARAAGAAGLGQAVAVAQDTLQAQFELLDTPATPAPESSLLTKLAGCLAGPAPQRPVEELFAAICVQAHALYEGDWPPEIAFKLVKLIAPPRRIPADPYSLSAEVDFATRKPTVYLGIHAPTFGPATFSAIPRVLAHECVCHLAGRPLGVVDNHSAFSEGLMDWAAIEYLTTWIPYLPCISAAGAATHARMLSDLSTSLPNRHSGARATGYYAADLLLMSLRDLERYEARMAVADLAIALNRLDVPLERKTAWVLDLAIGEVSPADPNVQAALRGCGQVVDIL
jgi:hypothetical protein